MENKWEIIDHIFKFRVGDSDEKGGCTFIGGEWKDVTSKELFAGKKIKSEENKYVEFDSSLKHTGTTCTDQKRRVVINFNYE